MDDELDTLEAIDTLGDSLDLLSATDPITAIVPVIAEEVILEPIRDLLERI